jgi:hypothetical protein
MIPRFLQLTGVTKVNRHEMISRVKEAILRGGGYVTDFHMFSNAAICLNFEVSVGNIGSLYESLVATGLSLSQESHDALAGYPDQQGLLVERAEAADVMGTLNITFIHDEPDLRIEAPPIPG